VVTAAELAGSMSYYPLVGLVVGLAYALVFFAAGRVLPEGVALVLVLAAGILLTGGLHWDGLADTCDGLFGGNNPERRRRIMKDSTLGTFGALGLLVVFALKYEALSAMPRGALYPALLAGPVLARWAMVFSTHVYRKALDPESLGGQVITHLPERSFWAATAAAVVISLFVLGAKAVVPWIILTAGLTGLCRLTERRLGGAGGDVLGAAGELAETLAWVAVAAVF